MKGFVTRVRMKEIVNSLRSNVRSAEQQALVSTNDGF